MSEDRTLPASSRRRAEAIRTSGLPRSPNLTSALVVLAAAVYCLTTGVDVLLDAAHWLASRLAYRGIPPGTDQLISEVQSSLWAGIGLMGGLVLTVLAAAMAADVLQSGGRVATSAFQPNLQRGASRILTGVSPLRLLAELLRWTIPLGLLALLLATRWRGVIALMHEPAGHAPALAGELMWSLWTRLAGALLLLGIAHYGWSRWRWERSLAMTPEEQREEQRHESRRRTRGRPVHAITDRPTSYGATSDPAA